MNKSLVEISANNLRVEGTEVEGVLQCENSNQLKLKTWILNQRELLKEQENKNLNVDEQLCAVEYIQEHHEAILNIVENNAPCYVRFSAETDIECLLNYGSELIQSNAFAVSYNSAFRKLQQEFVEEGYEFSDVIFTFVDNGCIALLWEVNKPVLFQDILEYPESLMTFASLLDELQIYGLRFGSVYHSLQVTTDEIESECLSGCVFKEGYFDSYGNSDCHLIQECPVDFEGFIHYKLDGGHYLELVECANTEFLEGLVESGYHLAGKELKSGLRGIAELEA